MGWRSELEDRYTVRCRRCGQESVDPGRKPNQKYAKGRCPTCGAGESEEFAGNRPCKAPSGEGCLHGLVRAGRCDCRAANGNREFKG